MLWTRPLAVLLLCVSVATGAKSQASSAETNVVNGTYPNTTDGLQSLIGDIFQAVKEKNKTKEAALIQGLLIPEGSTWFTDIYGPGFGASLAAAYRRDGPALQEEITTIYEADADRGWTSPKILRYTDPAAVNAPLDHFLNSMNQIVPLYSAASGPSGNISVMLALKPGAKSHPAAGDLDGYFIYDRGSFRFIPMDVLLLLPNERPIRIQLGINVMQSKIIERAFVRIPPEAIQKHISGRVVLDVVVDTNGNVKESRVLQGDPILVAAVMDAFKQFRFAPTTLDGDPVEVEFQMPFEFQIN